MSDFDKRPWGHYHILHKEPGIQVKRIEVSPGLQFSLQKHLKRTERWTVLSGVGIATVGDQEISVKEGTFVEILCGEKHRMKNTGSDPLVLIEVQFGEYLGEDDIVRFADDFGRAK